MALLLVVKNTARAIDRRLSMRSGCCRRSGSRSSTSTAASALQPLPNTPWRIWFAQPTLSQYKMRAEDTMAKIVHLNRPIGRSFLHSRRRGGLEIFPSYTELGRCHHWTGGGG